MANYIVCEGQVTSTNDCLFVQCSTNNVSTVLNDSEFQEQMSQSLTPEQHAELGTLLWLICALAWGYRKILKLMEQR